MLTTSIPDLDLLETFFDSDPDRCRVRVTFPINKWAGSADSAVVYFEVEPGKELPAHTDSAEEVLYIVAGQAQARVGDEEKDLRAGDLAVIPALVPHGLTSTGEETLKVVGFFGAAEVESSFNEPVQPVGAQTLTQGAPAPADS